MCAGRPLGHRGMLPDVLIQWYKNVFKNPQIRIDARGAEVEFRAIPITEASAVNSVVDRFRERYGGLGKCRSIIRYSMWHCSWNRLNPSHTSVVVLRPEWFTHLPFAKSYLLSF
jgi:hypothetical protein